jgi:aryl-alcohol dehydrogenase-like predicted oxidoreductase
MSQVALAWLLAKPVVSAPNSGSAARAWTLRILIPNVN